MKSFMVCKCVNNVDLTSLSSHITYTERISRPSNPTADLVSHASGAPNFIFTGLVSMETQACCQKRLAKFWKHDQTNTFISYSFE